MKVSLRNKQSFDFLVIFKPRQQIEKRVRAMAIVGPTQTKDAR